MSYVNNYFYSRIGLEGLSYDHAEHELSAIAKFLVLNLYRQVVVYIETQ